MSRRSWWDKLSCVNNSFASGIWPFISSKVIIVSAEKTKSINLHVFTKINICFNSIQKEEIFVIKLIFHGTKKPRSLKYYRGFFHKASLVLYCIFEILFYLFDLINYYFPYALFIILNEKFKGLFLLMGDSCVKLLSRVKILEAPET